jgi:diguanylate cyclase (GGDEF)-like protein
MKVSDPPLALPDAPLGDAVYPMHPREAERVARLREYEILDTGPDAAFDALVALASHVTDTPIGAISFVDRDREWFKSTHGFFEKQTPRSDAFCAHAILQQKPVFVVSDALKDERFSKNPLVTGEPHIRFYAGIPLVTPDGLPLGSFCVMDHKPRELTPVQMDLLQQIARIAMDLADRQRHARILEKHVLFGEEMSTELPAIVSRITAPKGALHGVVEQLIQQYGGLFGWVAARIHYYPAGRPVGIYQTSSGQPKEGLQNLWAELDGIAPPAPDKLLHGILETTDATCRECHYAMVPLKFGERILARVDFLCPSRPDTHFEGLFALMLATFSDLAERDIKMEELKYLTEHDSLTGLGNRGLLIAKIDRAIQRMDLAHPDAVLFNIRFDSLIEINDNFGYVAGDKVLIEAARRLRGLSQGKAFISRDGGNKFAVFLTHADPVNDLEDILDEVEKCVAKPFYIDGDEIWLHADIGCAVLSEPSLHPMELHRRAEVAMRYAATQEVGAQRDTYIYHDKLFEDRVDRHHFNLLVRQAFNDQRFFLLFQPGFDLSRNRLVSAEALLRMKDRDGKILEAGQFVSAIPRIRYQATIDQWVFSEFVRQFANGGPARKLMEEGEFYFSLNVTPSLLGMEGLASKWLARLAAADIFTSSFVVEIVENPLLIENKTIMRNLCQLRDAGVKIAIDDFGSGFSNLRHLTHLPVDIVKLDKAFFHEHNGSESKSRILLAGMIRLCLELGYFPVCEGVETAEQAAFLLETGCRQAQGFFYGRAMPLEDLLALASP